MYEYKLAADGMTVREGIDYILDAASGVLSLDAEGRPTNGALFDGFAIALGSLLSSDERPAEDILIDAIDNRQWAVLVLSPRMGDRVHGPYERRGKAVVRFQDLRDAGVPADSMAIKVLHP